MQQPKLNFPALSVSSLVNPSETETSGSGYCLAARVAL